MKNTMEMNKLNMDELEMVCGGTEPIGTCDSPRKTGSLNETGPLDETGPLGYPYGYPYGYP